MHHNYSNRLLLKIPVLVFLSLAFAFAFTPLHKYYFSFTEIRVDTKKATLNVSCKMFTDDLETSMSNIYGKKIVLADVKQHKEIQRLLDKYMAERFKISVAGKALKLVFIGYENEDDVIWCYLEVPKLTKKAPLTIMNSVLFELFPEQTNIIQVYWDEQNKSQKLVNPQKEAVFEF